MRDSIFYSVIRAFFVALFSIIGLCFGLLLATLLIASFSTSTTTTEDIPTSYAVEILPNAEGVRKTEKDAPVILTIDIDGVIGMSTLNDSTVRQQLIESQEGTLKDHRVKGVLLKINSPGGTVTDADGIYRAIKAYKEQYNVPVYAYVDGLCASGAMYIAAAADQIYASDVSLIGSVGVVTPSFFNFTKVLDKLGIDALTLTAGKDKDLLNPFRPWHAEEAAEMQAILDYYYNRFVEIVTTNRPKITKEQLVQDYGARVFNPLQAQDYGFINERGYSLNETLKLLLKAAEIHDNNYQVVRLKSSNWVDSLFKSEWNLLKGKVVHQIELSPELKPELMNQYLYLYRPA